MIAVLASPKMVPDQTAGTLSVGESVIDSEDDDPNEAIVIWRPDDQTIADWEYETDAGTRTTADDNPDCPSDAQLVVVAFRSALANAWPDWQDADSDALFGRTGEREINRYGFPERRLERIEPGALDAQWLEGLADRLADAGWEVTHNSTNLVVQQFDEEYRITADGTVAGDGDNRTPLETLVENERT